MISSLRKKSIPWITFHDILVEYNEKIFLVASEDSNLTSWISNLQESLILSIKKAIKTLWIILNWKRCHTQGLDTHGLPCILDRNREKWVMYVVQRSLTYFCTINHQMYIINLMVINPYFIGKNVLFLQLSLIEIVPICGKKFWPIRAF